ncbi:MAG: hypothetical protein TEF_08610 [Rhizobiales bacterium NRL2]|jgi:putative transposase|nr:MAG: hypothetical protein TEF_08610 [Rhizobiales bacterium NRL2]
MDFLRRALKRFGSTRTIVTDRLRSYRAAFSSLGIGDRQDTTRWRNNRAENSHQPSDLNQIQLCCAGVRLH